MYQKGWGPGINQLGENIGNNFTELTEGSDLYRLGGSSSEKEWRGLEEFAGRGPEPHLGLSLRSLRGEIRA